jgi:hypothetical protein
MSQSVLEKELEVGSEERPRNQNEGGGIRCPKCGCRPRAKDLWACNCRHLWNTFDTGESVPLAITSGGIRCASLAPNGRRFRIGIRPVNEFRAKFSTCPHPDIANEIIRRVDLLLESGCVPEWLYVCGTSGKR